MCIIRQRRSLWKSSFCFLSVSSIIKNRLKKAHNWYWLSKRNICLMRESSFIVKIVGILVQKLESSTSKGPNYFPIWSMKKREKKWLMTFLDRNAFWLMLYQWWWNNNEESWTEKGGLDKIQVPALQPVLSTCQWVIKDAICT